MQPRPQVDCKFWQAYAYFLVLPDICRDFCHPAQVARLCSVYLRWRTPGVWAYAAFSSTQGFLQSQRIVNPPAYANLLAALLHPLGTFLLMHPLGELFIGSTGPMIEPDIAGCPAAPSRHLPAAAPARYRQLHAWLTGPFLGSAIEHTLLHPLGTFLRIVPLGQLMHGF